MTHLRYTVLILLLTAAAVGLAACGGGGGASAPTTNPRPDGKAEPTAAVERRSTHTGRPAYLDRVRDAVVHGAAADFALGTGIGGPSFEACVKDRLRGALDGPMIDRLVGVYRRPHGAADAAQALNAVTAPLAARCGHRDWVPELVEAARGLRSAAPIGAGIARLGITYGPYLGRRCRNVHRGCGLVGIDVVFAKAAAGVEATAGDQTIRLRTPGRHSGIEHRDWVGTFTRTGFARTPHPHRDRVYVDVELRVLFADGRAACARLPHVLVGSGWG